MTVAPPTPPTAGDVFVMPASYAQERIWFLDRMDAGASFNLPATVRLRGSLDRGSLRAAVEALVRRHEVLRTTLDTEDDTPMQVIHPRLPPAWSDADLTALPAAVREEAQRRIADVTGTAPFDLATGPLLRACLLRLAADDHVLVLNVHHTVADGWSIGIMVRELGQVYAALRAGRAPVLPELPIQYVDYAIWQRDREGSEVRREALEHWRRRLHGLGDGRVLDPDRLPQRRRGHFRSATREAALEAALGDRVKGLAQRHRATPFMVLLAALQVLLARHSGRTRVPVGTPVAGRERRETRHLVGLFLNTLVLAGDLSGEPTFDDLVRRTRESVAADLAHQDLPFDRLLEELRPDRDLGETPFFQVFFNMLTFPFEPLRLAGLEVEPQATPEVGAKFDLTVYAEERGDRLHLRWTWDRDRFDDDRMEELFDQYRVLLEHLVGEPERSIWEPSLITPRATAVLPRRRPLPTVWPGAVHAGFLRQAAMAPGAPAVVDGRRLWSYGELAEHSAALANLLRERGVGRGDVVAIYAHRSAPVALAVLAVLRAGAAFTLFDPDHPDDRLLDQARACEPVAWICLQAAGATPPALEEELAGLPRLDLADDPGDLDALLAAADHRAPDVTVGPDDLACVAFTSGSMGRPRGVLGRHGSLSHFLPWQSRRWELGAQDRFSGLSGLAHDPFQRDLFTPLWCGASLHLPSPRTLGEPGVLSRWLDQREITVAHLTPAMSRLILDTAPADLRLPGLRLVYFIGEALRYGDVGRLERLAPDVEVVNLYGTTETQRALTFHELDTAERQRAGRGAVVPVGRGMEGCQAWVLNRVGRPAGIGERGQVVVRSPHLARGYLGRPGDTAAGFRPDPLTTPQQEGVRAYHTGDLGRYRPDGSLALLGRSDDQVQIRGFRVEPEEVASRLDAHPGVANAAVLAVPRGETGEDDGADEHLLAAFLVPHDTASPPGRDELRSFLAQRLPSYMVPALWRFLDAMPLLASGKVDRRSLRRRLGDRPAAEAGAAPVPPRTTTEQLLAELWTQVLDVDEVGVHDDFMALGGHSLLATRLAARVRRVFGVELPLATLFAEPTLAGQAQALDDALAYSEDLLPPVKRAAGEGPVPLSFTQRRLWFIEQLDPTRSLYSVPVALRLKGALDTVALERALGEVERRHDVLRTSFPAPGGDPVQRLRPPAPYRLPRVDLTALPPPRAEALTERGKRSWAGRPFDLAEGPLWRAVLLHLAGEEHVLFLNLHHTVVDGWSLGLLRREIGLLYNAFVGGAPSPLEPLPLQYADYAVWQHRLLDEGLLRSGVEYWRRRLDALPPDLGLPVDRPAGSGEVAGEYGAAVHLRLDPLRVAALEEMGQCAGATLFMVLMAAFQLLLARHAEEDDVAVASPVAGRPSRDLEDLIGAFVNTLVLRTRVESRETFASLLQRVRRITLEAFGHQAVPFGVLVDELVPERRLGHSPLVQVMMVLQNLPGEGPPLEGLEVETLAPATTGPKFDLALTWLPDADGSLTGRLVYDRSRFDPTTARRLVGHLDRLLAGIDEDPQRQVERIPMLFPAERQQLTVEWNDTAHRSPRDPRVYRWITAVAEKRPDAVALEWGGDGDAAETMTYGELERRSRRLALHLRRLGVGPEVRVGLRLERGPELILSLLAVWRAGGAWVAVDPVDPPARRARVLRLAGPAVVLTRGADAGDGEGLRDELPAAARVVEIDRLEDAVDAAGDAAGDAVGDPLPPPPAGAAAYVMFTSGSTGEPKGAVITHRNLANLSAWVERRMPFTPDDRMLHKTPLGFDAAVWEVVSPLAAGARLYLARPDGHRDGAYLARTLRDAAVTVVQLVPSQLAMLLAEPAFTEARHLRRLCSGGERLPPGHVKEVLERREGGPGLEVVNLYGPAETCVQVLSWHTRGHGRDEVRLGRPVDNVQVHLLDPSLRPTPLGAVGQICISGAAVGRGYLGRPRLTAERFRPDPLAREAGARLYLSGDLGRHDGRGRLRYRGRLDHQLKLAGVRVEGGEVEAALIAVDGVEAAAVRTWSGDRGERLVAYLEGDPPAVGELRRRLLDWLPAATVPAEFVHLGHLPRLPSGKVDRNALPRPEGTDAGGTGSDDPLVEVVAGLWSELLDVDRVGPEDDFFALGGHSLLATRMVAHLRRRTGREVPVRALFEAPTPAALVRRLRRVEEAGEPPLEAVSREGELPISFAQERLWFLHLVEPDSAAYNLALAYELEGRLDVTALRHALRLVLDRHEVLRISLEERGERPVARLRPVPAAPLTVADLAALPDERRDDEADRLVEAVARHPFRLHRAPLLRAAVVRRDDGSAVLAAAVHHVAGDGWSMAILAEEVAEIYAAVAEERPPALPPVPVGYPDYAAWQRRIAADDGFDDALDHWRSRLAGLDGKPPLPGAAEGRARSGSGKRPVELAADVATALRRLAGERSATLFMTLFAALQATLHGLGAGTDLTVGTPVADRRRPELERLIGLFLNTVVLRLDLSGDPTFGELVDRAREVALDAYQHRAVPFARVVEAVRPEGGHDRSPLFRVWFVLQNTPRTAFELPGLTLEPRASGEAEARHDLKLDLVEEGGHVRGFFQYRRGVLDAAAVAAVAAAFTAVARRAAERPDVPLSELAEEAREAAEVARGELTERFHDQRRTRLAGLRRGARKDSP